MLTTIKGSLEWTDKTEWTYPQADEHTIDWPFTHGSIDVDSALTMMEPRLKGKRTCIQAGGAIGIWPLRLAQYFENVYTFEPEPTNYECLIQNTAGVENITCEQAALGDSTDPIHMALDSKMQGHCGAWQVRKDGTIPMIKIDDLNVQNVDLIYLDIEGYEYYALQGAAETIQRDKPVIGLEDKGLHGHFDHKLHAVKLLTRKMGYRILGRPQSTDVILIHETSTP